MNIQMHINIKTISRFNIFLFLLVSLLACSNKQPPMSGVVLYAAKKVNIRNSKNIEFEQEKDQKMLVKLGGFSFVIPDKWRDTSSYIYKSKQQNIALTVSFGNTRETMTLEKLVAQRRQELSDTMGNEVEFLSLEQGDIAKLPAIYQSFSFGDQSNQYLEYQAIAYYEENKYLVLSYVGPRQEKNLQTTFEHIMASGQPSSDTQPKQTAEGYVWRQVQILSLQIPEALHPPRHYSYVSQDGSLKLKVSYYKPGDNVSETSIEDQTAKDLRFDGTQGTFSKAYKNNLAIQQIDYVFKGGDPLEPTLYRAHRAEIAGVSGRLFLYLKGNGSQANQIDAIWLQFMTELIENNILPASSKMNQANPNQQE